MNKTRWCFTDPPMATEEYRYEDSETDEILLGSKPVETLTADYGWEVCIRLITDFKDTWVIYKPIWFGDVITISSESKTVKGITWRDNG